MEPPPYTPDQARAILEAARAYVLAEHEITQDVEGVRRAFQAWAALVATISAADPALAEVVQAWRTRHSRTDEE